MSRRRRGRSYVEPVQCICQPGKFANPQHAKPGAKAPAHTDPRCPHSELANTTRALPKPKKRKNTRVDL